MLKERRICCHTAEGRKEIHDNLLVNIPLMLALMRQPLYGGSAEYADNRISHFTAQWGKCAVIKSKKAKLNKFREKAKLFPLT